MENEFNNVNSDNLNNNYSNSESKFKVVSDSHAKNTFNNYSRNSSKN